MPDPTALDIELAVAKHLDYRRNLIVPNVHWGLWLPYEADLVVLRPSNWAIEVEIKVSAADIRADLNKRYQHNARIFRELYFAVPDALKDNPHIPERAGILSVGEWNGRLRVKKHRSAERRKDAVKFSAEYRQKLYDLAAMRTWALKQQIAARRTA